MGFPLQAGTFAYEPVCTLDLPHTNPYVKWVPAKKRVPVRRDEQKQHSREALVRAALELFAEEGLDRPSLDAICERAGYTRGAFYVHFRDREDLLVAVMDHVGQAFLASVFDEQARAGEPRRGHLLGDTAARFVDAVRSGRYPLMRGDAGASRHARPGKAAGSSKAAPAPAIRPHQLLDACARSEVVRARYRDLVETSAAGVAALAAEDQRAGTIRADVDAKAMGQMALALIVGAQSLTEIGVALDPASLAESLMTLLTSRGGGASR
jgi:TetR/AcrR family transcriptional repressor of nem operon